eukprot:GFYU01024804.1.p1 GENE.GFYU01024804.1~~GFYU01024804.1.p1  ORF type:complete len:366 (+),score=0.32 GFYU01024804.1:3-1100(+)
MQESVIANLTSALQRSADEREDMAKRAKEREELLESTMDDLRSQLEACTLQLAAATSSSSQPQCPIDYQQHHNNQHPKGLSPDAVWESTTEDADEAGQSATSFALDSYLGVFEEDDDDQHHTDEESQHPTAVHRRSTMSPSAQLTAAAASSKSQSVQRHPKSATKGSSSSPSPLGAHASPSRASASPKKGASITNAASLGPLLKYQGLLSGTVRRHDPHSTPISISRTYKELLKYQSLDPHVHEYLVTLENENKSLRKEVEYVNKVFRERESEHERIRNALQKRVSTAEDSSRSLAHQVATLDGELQSMKRLYNDTADELAKTLTSTTGNGGGGMGLSVSAGGGGAGPLGRRSSYSHFNTFNFGE